MVSLILLLNECTYLISAYFTSSFVCAVFVLLSLFTKIRAAVRNVLLWICTCENVQYVPLLYIQQGLIKSPGYYLFAIFTAPALVMPPEIHTDEGRRAVVFSAGFWRAADRDALRADHLKTVWRLLLVQRHGVPIKSQIPQTAWQRWGES